MTLALYRRVVLTQGLPEEGFRAGDVGVIVGVRRPGKRPSTRF